MACVCQSAIFNQTQWLQSETEDAKAKGRFWEEMYQSITVKKKNSKNNVV